MSSHSSVADISNISANERLHRDKRQNFNLKFFKRFWRVLFVIFPQWKSITLLLFIALLCLVLLEQYVIYQVGMIPSKYYLVLGEKDSTGFRQLTIIAVLVIIAIAFIVATKKYVCSVFYVTTRCLLTKYLHCGYFTDIVYYTLNVLDEAVDNPDQRISQDVDRMCKAFSSIIADLLISPFTIAYYTYYTWTSMGYIGPVCVLAFFAISTVINKFLMSPVVALVFKQEQREGDFRFKHMQIRSNCESLAFYRGGQLEQRKIDEKLDLLMSTQQRLNVRQYLLMFSVGLADYLGSILSYVIIAIPIFAGKYDDLTPAELSALISKNAFVTIYLISCFTRLIDMSLQVADIAGTTHRIIQLDERMSELKGRQSGGGTAGLLGSPSTTGSVPPSLTHDGFRDSSYVAVRVDNISFSAPKGDVDRASLIKNLSFELQSGVNILVTGDSGCGKSSLLRVLDRLWNHKGSIVWNVTHGYQGVLVLPQKPYITDGTLRQQITFPYSNIAGCNHGVEDGQLLDYLRDAGLIELYERIGGLDCPVAWNWCDMLSPGEMQRISFVRLFFHRPPFAFLDEATSQVGLAMERHLYTVCQQLNITLLSVGHRDSLRQFHHKELHIDTGGNWQLLDIVDYTEQNAAGGSTDNVVDVRF